MTKARNPNVEAKMMPAVIMAIMPTKRPPMDRLSVMVQSARREEREVERTPARASHPSGVCGVNAFMWRFMNALSLGVFALRSQKS